MWYNMDMIERLLRAVGLISGKGGYLMNKKALIIIDVQLGLFDESNPVNQGNSLLKKIKKLISKGRSVDTPIVYIQHNARVGMPLEPGKPGWEIHPLIKPERNDVVIQKTTPDSFYNTLLQKALYLRGVKELLITGIQSEVCVDTTCRRAFSEGYKVTLLSDVHSTWDTDHLTAQQIITHHNHVLNWFAEVKDSEKVIESMGESR